MGKYVGEIGKLQALISCANCSNLLHAPETLKIHHIAHTTCWPNLVNKRVCKHQTGYSNVAYTLSPSLSLALFHSYAAINQILLFN